MPSPRDGVRQPFRQRNSVESAAFDTVMRDDRSKRNLHHPERCDHKKVFHGCFLRGSWLQAVATMIRVFLMKSPRWGGIMSEPGQSDPKVVQELLRHASFQITMNTYTQALTDDKRSAHRDVIRLVVPRQVPLTTADYGGECISG